MSKEVSKPAAVGIIATAVVLVGGLGFYLVNRSSNPVGRAGMNGIPTDMSKIPLGMRPAVRVMGSEEGDLSGARGVNPMGMPPGMGMQGRPGMPPGMGMQGRPGMPPGGAAMPGSMGGGMPMGMPKIKPDGTPELPEGAPPDTVIKRVENPSHKR